MKYRLLLADLAPLMLTAAAPTPYGYALFDGADPDLNYFAGKYWIYTTDGNAWSSSNLSSWTAEGTVFNLSGVSWLDRTRANYLWAPDMVAMNGKYNLYYSVGGSTTNQKPNSIGVAVCDTPSGPCTDSGRALLTPPAGTADFEAIDPAVFADSRSGNLYLYAGGSAAQDGHRLRIYTLTADGLRIRGRVTAPNGTGEAYQPTDFTEGAFMHRRGDIYYLSYSNGYYGNSSYRVRYATSNNPTGPWTDRGVILQSDSVTKGPGHHAVLQLPNSDNWIAAYHRWEGRTGDGPYDGQRQTALARVTYNADGTIQRIDPNAH